MNIIVDVDDTLCDLLTEWIGRYNILWDDILTVQNITRWNLHELVKPECGKRIYEILEDENLYDHISPYSGSLEFINQLRKDHHHVIFVTSPYGKSAGQKLQWLSNYGFLPKNLKYHSDYIECSDKTLICGDYIVDDKEETVEKWLTKHEQGWGCLYKQPYNYNQKIEKNLKIPAGDGFCFFLHSNDYNEILKHINSI